MPHRNESGVALLMALFTVVIISYLAVEISYEAGVEYRLSLNHYEELKARHAAKSGVELSLLRIQMFKQVSQQFGEQIPDKSMLDMIWNFPLSWPPTLPDEASMGLREDLNAILQDTFQDAAWSALITSESSKIDINDLNSPIESLRNAVAKKLLQILNNRLNDDSDWAVENRHLDAEEIINNIIDYISPETESVSGGNKETKYGELARYGLPPGRDLKTIEELRLVAGITDDIYKILQPHITIYGVRGINVNYAEKDLIIAIDEQITEEIADEILTRRRDPEQGPFKDIEDFLGFISSFGIQTDSFNEANMPLRFSRELNFKIHSVGIYRNRRKEIIAYVYDFTSAQNDIKNLIEEDLKRQRQNSGEDDTSSAPPPENGSNQPNNQQQRPQFDQGRPRILFWKET